MSRTVPIQAHLNTGRTTLAWLLRLELRDSSVLYFTDHNENILYGGDVYVANQGFQQSDISTSASIEVGTIDIEGALDALGFDEADIRGGLYDNAQVYLGVINYDAPTDGIIMLTRGVVANITIRDYGYRTEVRDLLHVLHQCTLRAITPSCPVDLGSVSCGVNVTPFTFAVQVATVDTEREKIVVTEQSGSIPELDTAGMFVGGHIEWTSGANTGYWSEVKLHDETTRTLTLLIATGFDVAVGDTFNLVVGCDKTISTCETKFSNALNFQGFPDLPGWNVNATPDYSKD